MHRIILYITVLVCSFLTKIYGQESEGFESKIKSISDTVTEFVTTEKQNLKRATDSINLLVQPNKLSLVEAEKLKIELSQQSEAIIAKRIANEQEKVTALVQQTVDEQLGKEIKEESSSIKRTQNKTYGSTNWKIGKSNLLGGSESNGMDLSVGVVLKTRLLEDYTKLYLTYGLDYNTNWFFLKSNKYFVVNGEQTLFQEYEGNLLESSNFMNSYLRIPIGLELDFSKNAIVNDEDVIRYNRSFRVGVGAFIGYNVDSKQTLNYYEDGRRIQRTKRADWNVNGWQYGISSYVMYKNIGLYVDYSLNPVFRNNPENQNVISFGIIFN